MKIKFFLLIAIFFTSCSNIDKKEELSLYENNNYESILEYKIPSILIGYGLLSHHIKGLRRIDHKVTSKVRKNTRKTHEIDDFTQFIPLFSFFTLDEKYASNHVRNEKLVIAGTSLLTTNIIVSSMKKTTRRWRPDITAPNSFPSGHTSTAFMGAHLLYKEYKDIDSSVSKIGYFIASLTGALRIVNNRHWLSDVLTGAGIGILSAEFGYYAFPKVMEHLDVEYLLEDITLIPIIKEKKYGLDIIYRF